MARLFLALWPPPDAVSVLEQLPRKPRPRVRWVPPEHWHITLRFLGDARPEEVIDALRGVELPPTEARLGPATDLLGDRALILPADGVDEMAAMIRRSTAAIGTGPPPRRFAGHLTLARLRRGARLDGLVGRLVAADFPVHEVALVESRLRPDGARYETMATWPVAT